MVNIPLIRPFSSGGYIRGGWLTSHDRLDLPPNQDNSHKEARVVVSNILYFHPDPWGNDPI